MLKSVIERLRQKNRTVGYPRQEPTLPERYRGCPSVRSERCPADCARCVEVCPAEAMQREGEGQGDLRVRMDLGRCLFCGACEAACPAEAISFSRQYQMAARERGELVLEGETLRRVRALEEKSRRLFGRSLKLRQVSAGGCNACEADSNVLGTVVWDLGRFGIQFVASPRHADGLLVTGPVPRNMQLALRKTYEAVAAPKLVIAVGACAISGGIFAGNEEVTGGADATVPVDLYIPGCPPHPVTILDGMLRLLGRVEDKGAV